MQSFPSGFAFSGSQASQYAQIGNAVPPLLGRAVAARALAPEPHTVTGVGGPQDPSGTVSRGRGPSAGHLNGSLLFRCLQTQRDWKHAILADGARGGRISLTFRRLNDASAA